MGRASTRGRTSSSTSRARITYSVAITKGRDTPFTGAVDGLRIGGPLLDLEETGGFARDA